ncbi:Fibronectin type-III domain-containing protein [Aphelenchoides fujianensis]|nr:Fibronectin type-III domain-containing protein [Aphelenchoides fujianensis]
MNLPTQIAKLESLSLAQNEQEHFPWQLHSHARLRTLDLSGNPFERIVFLLPRLVVLRMRQMLRLHTIENIPFSLFTNLRVLDLAGSKKLTAICADAFGFAEPGPKARALRVLNVENCALSSLDSRTFPLHQMERLHLNGNPWNCDEKMEWLFLDTSYVR